MAAGSNPAASFARTTEGFDCFGSTGARPARGAEDDEAEAPPTAAFAPRLLVARLARFDDPPAVEVVAEEDLRFGIGEERLRKE